MREEAVRLTEQYNIHPIIAKTWHFREAKRAFEMLMSQKEVGKVVVKITDE